MFDRVDKGLWWDRNWELLNGCKNVSPACENCFSARYVHRFKGDIPRFKGLTDEHGKWTGDVRLCPENLNKPLMRQKPTAWFVTERGDLFHVAVAFDYLIEIFAVMARSPQHRFLLLTKRPDMMLNRLVKDWRGFKQSLEASLRGYVTKFFWPLPNVWLGVTAENQRLADERWEILSQIEAAGRFISYEPALGPLSMANWATVPNWVICGGESGPGARPMHPSWVRSLRDQCLTAGVPYFFKQWGEWYPVTRDVDFRVSKKKNPLWYIWPDEGFESTVSNHIGKTAAGRILDGKEWMQMPANIR